MIKILIVEDDPAIAGSTAASCSASPVLRCWGGVDPVRCQEQIGILRPDLVLLDVWLPDGEGSRY